jgi:hypothetical protein
MGAWEMLQMMQLNTCTSVSRMERTKKHNMHLVVHHKPHPKQPQLWHCQLRPSYWIPMVGKMS